MAKFKVCDKVNHFAKGDGFVVKYDIDPKTAYPIKVSFSTEDYTFTSDGRLYEEEESSLRLTGRPFNVGDMVVIGGEKGKVNDNSHQNTLTPVSVFMGFAKEHVYITTDGRAWPGTPIIAEHDWEEESESEPWNESENHIEDVTVSPEEVRHIAEMQGKALSGQAESDILKKQHNYTRMALSLTGFKLDKEAAALITETVKRVLELGGEFSLDTAREVEARVNEMYEN